MPIYEFKCEKCKHGFEQLVMRKDEKVLCPRCSSPKVARLMSRFSKSGNSDSIGEMGGMGGCSGCSGGNCATCF